MRGIRVYFCVAGSDQKDGRRTARENDEGDGSAVVGGRSEESGEQSETDGQTESVNAIFGGGQRGADSALYTREKVGELATIRHTHSGRRFVWVYSWFGPFEMDVDFFSPVP